MTSAGEFLSQALSRIRTVADGEAALRQRMKGDMQFREGSGQWPEVIRQDRSADSRPVLTINRIPQFLRQVTNQQRTSRPAIQVNPITGGATVKTAEALQGIIRSIEINSDADVAYATACDHQVTMGRGYWRVLTDWAEDDGFEQVIRIDRILDPLSVFMDASGTRVDGADARYCFIIEDIPREEFIRLYGEEALAGQLVFPDAHLPDSAAWWMPEGRVRIAEYFYKEYTTETMVRLQLPKPGMVPPQASSQVFSLEPNQDGEQEPPAAPPLPMHMAQRITIPKSALPDTLPPGWTVLDERDVDIPRVKWAKITASAVLDGNDDRTAGRDWPGRFIPIIPVLGDELMVGGRLDLRGMVRDAQGPQQMYNFWASAMTEQIALAPRAPYIAAEGQIPEPHKNAWDTANRKNYSVLYYKPVAAGGQLAPVPQRNQFNADVSSIVEAFKLADNDLKAVMGLYDASLGASGPEQSGRAILARQRQGEVGNSNYLDNLARAIRHTGRVILDLIPKVYTPTRVLRILGADDLQKKILVHQGLSMQDMEAMRAAEGISEIYDISVGRYDVSLSVGPSLQSRRQEAVSSLLELIKSNPQFFTPALSDLMVGSMDWPGASQAAARLQKMVPPQLLNNAEEGGGQPQQDPKTMAMIQHLQQNLQALLEERQAKTLETASRERIALAEMQSRERMATWSDRAMIIQGLAKADVEKAREIAVTTIQAMDAQAQRLHELNLAAVETPPPPGVGGAAAGAPPVGAPPTAPPGGAPLAAPGPTGA